MTPLPRPRTVLLVEDDQAIRESVAECLEGEGYEVVTTGDGAEALAWLGQGGRPDLVLLDMVMPVMTGTELVARIRADPALARLPVVLMTAAMQQGGPPIAAEAFLPKPFDLNELLGTVRRACGLEDEAATAH